MEGDYKEGWVKFPAKHNYLSLKKLKGKPFTKILPK
jgi:hypothetical protein